MGQTMGWRRSSRCESNQCVELSAGSTRVAVRDSTNPGEWLTASFADWREFVAGLRAGAMGGDER